MAPRAGKFDLVLSKAFPCVRLGSPGWSDMLSYRFIKLSLRQHLCHIVILFLPAIICLFNIHFTILISSILIDHNWVFHQNHKIGTLKGLYLEIRS